MSKKGYITMRVLLLLKIQQEMHEEMWFLGW